MSYLLLIQAGTLHNVHALVTAIDPQARLALMSMNSPVPVFMRHQVYAGTHSALLLRTLEIGYRAQHLHHCWYALTPAAIKDIMSLDTGNFHLQIKQVAELALKLEKQLHPENYPAPVIVPPPPKRDLEAERRAILEDL